MEKTGEEHGTSDVAELFRRMRGEGGVSDEEEQVGDVAGETIIRMREGTGDSGTVCLHAGGDVTRVGGYTDERKHSLLE